MRNCVFSPALRLGLLGALVVTGCATHTSPGVAPAAEVLLWPDPTFSPERQCKGAYKSEDLARFLPRAKLATTLPGAQSVAVDPARGCLTVNVRGVGSGRLAELVLRGVAVPRTAVLLKLVN